MLDPAVVGMLSGAAGAALAAGARLVLERSKPRADRQAGDASQIQALLASATYWEGQAKRFQSESATWQQEASEWHERFYRGQVDLSVLGRSARVAHDLAAQQVTKDTAP